MFEFKPNTWYVQGAGSVFQYIICLSSSRVVLLLNFNLLTFQYIICLSSRTEVQTADGEKTPFQYIICLSSSPKLIEVIESGEGFNTLYV